MLTGLEIPIIAAVTGKAIATFKFSRTSVLIDQTRDILNDDHITKSLILLYELNPKLASESDDRHKRARAIFNNLDLMKGRKYILIRHMSARNAKSLAALYRDVVMDNTTEAKIKQAREKARMREQMTHNKDITQTISNTRASGDHAITQTPKYIIQTSDMAAFAYPRGTPKNPTVSCPVGSKPILPDGFKFGTLAYYYQPSHVAMISSDDSSSATQTEEDDLVPVIEIRDIPKSSRSGVAQASSQGHRRQSTNREELVEDIIREDLQDIAGTAHFIGTLRAANGSDGDVASIATTYLSFDDTNTESESNFDSDY
ncbi:uncharacterized protein C8R40DRAFT_672325 [Lentinula edodes]|uniref:uncharacterized protein n=1 Tax=Lentinula edodes TaxID=5353 RepID=UPI001E8E6B02|nr:uncharacterized protein C8R40DRAFT_672325 [Lentinula edodes]KAH7870017.1 hypothetical protein C8R40DRAFT_672325 [Lentinula edodes]